MQNVSLIFARIASNICKFSRSFYVIFVCNYLSRRSSVFEYNCNWRKSGTSFEYDSELRLSIQIPRVDLRHFFLTKYRTVLQDRDETVFFLLFEIFFFF